MTPSIFLFSRPVSFLLDTLHPRSPVPVYPSPSPHDPCPVARTSTSWTRGWVGVVKDRHTRSRSVTRRDSGERVRLRSELYCRPLTIGHGRYLLVHGTYPTVPGPHDIREVDVLESLGELSGSFTRNVVSVRCLPLRPLPSRRRTSSGSQQSPGTLDTRPAHQGLGGKG